MTDQPLPSFDLPPEQEAPAPPKKPRQKPTRKRQVRKAKVADYPRTKAQKAVGKKRKNRRTTRQIVRVNMEDDLDIGGHKEKHRGGRYSKDVYAAIGKLMGMNNSERAAVLDIVKGLTDGRAD